MQMFANSSVKKATHSIVSPHTLYRCFAQIQMEYWYTAVTATTLCIRVDSEVGNEKMSNLNMQVQ